jgi:hypothetical protein
MIAARNIVLWFLSVLLAVGLFSLLFAGQGPYGWRPDASKDQLVTRNALSALDLTRLGHRAHKKSEVHTLVRKHDLGRHRE